MSLKDFDSKPVTQQRFIHTGSHIIRPVDHDEHELGHESWELVRTKVIGVGYKPVSEGSDEQRRIETSTVTRFVFLSEKVGNTLAEKYMPKEDEPANLVPLGLVPADPADEDTRDPEELDAAARLAAGGIDTGE